MAFGCRLGRACDGRLYGYVSPEPLSVDPIEPEQNSGQYSWRVDIDWDRDGVWDDEGTLYADRTLVPDHGSPTNQWEWKDTYAQFETMMLVSSTDMPVGDMAAIVGGGDFDGSTGEQDAAAAWANSLLQATIEAKNDPRYAMWESTLRNVLTQLYLLAETSPPATIDGPWADDRTVQQVFDYVSQTTFVFQARDVFGGAHHHAAPDGTHVIYIDLSHPNVTGHIANYGEQEGRYYVLLHEIGHIQSPDSSQSNFQEYANTIASSLGGLLNVPFPGSPGTLPRA